MAKDFEDRSKFTQHSITAFNKAFEEDNLAGSLGAISSGVSGIAGAFMSNNQIADTSSIESGITDFNQTQFGYGDYDSLLGTFDSNNLLRTNYDREDVRGVSNGQMFGNTLKGVASGAAAGLQIGGPWGALAGGVIGLGSGIAGIFTGNSKADEKASELNDKSSEANARYIAGFANNASNIAQNMFNNAALNLAAFGGDLDSYDASKVLTKSFKMKPRKSRYKGFGNYFAYGGSLSGSWSNGVIIVNEGDTHENNPLGGVMMGVDSQGVPNLVEENEVIFNDYVYSDRMKPTEKQLESVNLDPKFEGLSFAEIAKEIQKESEIRPLDYISKNTLVDGMSKLTIIQEESRMKKEERRIKRIMNSLPLEEQQMLFNEMSNPIPAEGNPEMMSTEDAMSIMNGHTPRAYNGIRDEMPDQYAFGGLRGNIFEGEGTSSNYLKTFGPISNFKYWDSNNNTYNADYLNWLNTTDLTKSDKWSTLQSLYKNTFNRNLTPEIARQLGQDKKYGEFHNAMGSAYDAYLASRPNSVVVNNSAANTYNPVTRYILESTDANGMRVETPIFAGGYNDQSADWGKYNFSRAVTADNGDVTNYFSAKPEDDESNSKDNKDDYPKPNALQYIPAIGSAIMPIVDMFTKPDYSNADLIARGRRGIRTVRHRPIGNYMSFNPYDINYQQNKLQNMNAGTQRNMLNLASGNRGAAMAGLLAFNNDAVGQSGDLYRQALEYNDQQRFKVGEFNTNIDRFNSQAGMQADQANLSADLQKMDSFYKEAILRDQIDTALSETQSAHLENFFNSTGELGKDIYANAQQKWLMEKGYIPGYSKSANGGKLRRRRRRGLIN